MNNQNPKRAAFSNFIKNINRESGINNVLKLSSSQLKNQFQFLKNSINSSEINETFKQPQIAVIVEDPNEKTYSRIIPKDENIDSDASSEVEDEYNNNQEIIYKDKNSIDKRLNNDLINSVGFIKNTVNNNNIKYNEYEINSNSKIENSNMTGLKVNNDADIGRYNTEVKTFITSLISLFEVSSFSIKWLKSSYQWVENRFIKNLLKKEQHKMVIAENKVNKPISERRKKTSEKMNIQKDNVLKTTDNNFLVLLNMIMGIQQSVNATANITVAPIVNISNYLKASRHTLPSSNFNSSDSTSTYFVESYADVLFNNLRKASNVSKEEYIQSMSPQDFITEMMISSNTIIEELFSTSKSGALFYHTRDGKYILKTLTVDEYKFFKKIFPYYYKHMLINKYSLLPKFYGCYKLVRRSQNQVKQRFYFFTMYNIFSTPRDIHLKYDLKGSEIGREVLPGLSEEEKLKETISFALKDLDLLTHKRIFNVGSRRDDILRQLEIDSNFLKEMNILDYSLLIGVHKLQNNELYGSTPLLESGLKQSNTKLINDNYYKFKNQTAKRFFSNAFLNKNLDNSKDNSTVHGLDLMNYNITPVDIDEACEEKNAINNMEHPFKDVNKIYKILDS